MIMQRQSVVTQSQIDRCRYIVESPYATNFERRMAAEVDLYWIIYQECCSKVIETSHARAALSEWSQEWQELFGEHFPRACGLDLFNKRRLRSAAIPVSTDGLPFRELVYSLSVIEAARVPN